MAKSTSTFTTAQIAVLEAFAQNTDSGLISNADIKALVLTDDFKGKTVPMLRGKVVAMKRYQTVAASPKPATESNVQRKSDFVSAVETLLSIPDGRLSSFEKASKADLQALTDALIALADKA
jgi:hypothetical protein|tara:strand:- start:148 stop:513 length:366 start_codon:yes stop_codon:yes gene_type:complete